MFTPFFIPSLLINFTCLEVLQDIRRLNADKDHLIYSRAVKIILYHYILAYFLYLPLSKG